MSQERIDELERQIEGKRVFEKYHRKELATFEEGIARMEAELARLRAEQQGWRATNSEYALVYRYERGAEFQYVPISLVAHIEAEATKKLREQLDEAVVILMDSTPPYLAWTRGKQDGWFVRRDALISAIREGGKPA